MGGDTSIIALVPLPLQGEKLHVSDHRVHGALLGVQQPLLREVLLLLLDRMSGKI